MVHASKATLAWSRNFWAMAVHSAPIVLHRPVAQYVRAMVGFGPFQSTPVRPNIPVQSIRVLHCRTSLGDPSTQAMINLHRAHLQDKVPPRRRPRCCISRAVLPFHQRPQCCIFGDRSQRPTHHHTLHPKRRWGLTASAAAKALALSMPQICLWVISLRSSSTSVPNLTIIR